MGRSADPFVRELYAMPPGEFTRARNARAAALKAAGHGDAARAVHGLRRPSPALWATNRLAHVAAERLGGFLDAVDELRQAQLRDPRATADALRRQRAGLDALVSEASEQLAGHGHRAMPATQRRIANTLLGAAVDRDRARALREGRLTEEVTAPGFEVLAGAPGGSHLRLVSPPSPGPTAATRGQKRREPARETDVLPRRAQREAQVEQERERRRLAAEELEREAAARRAAADAARREIEELARQTRAARDRLREAERAARAAATTGRKARRGADGRPAKAPGDDRGEAGR